MVRQMYVKVMKGKRTTYELVQPEIIEIDMTNEQILTLAASIATCCLMGLEKHMKPHTAIARRVVAVETALCQLAQLNSSKLDAEMLAIGTEAWSETMRSVAKKIKGADHDQTTN